MRLGRRVGQLEKQHPPVVEHRVTPLEKWPDGLRQAGEAFRDKYPQEWAHLIGEGPKPILPRDKRELREDIRNLLDMVAGHDRAHPNKVL